jgi:hypothetical protein
MVTSTENIRGFDSDTKVLIAVDTSASMRSLLNEKSTVMYADIGLLLGMMLQFKCKRSMSVNFAENVELVNFPKDNVLQNAMEFNRMIGRVGHSTNGWKVLRWATKENIKFDKVFFFSDHQWWDSSHAWCTDYSGKTAQIEWLDYKAKVNPQAKAYFFDVAGYGDVPLRLHSGDIHYIAGWSDKIFEVLDTIERGEDALKVIEEVQLG